MKKIASKMIPVACAISAPFFISADEQSDVSAMLCASSTPTFAANKVATTPNMQSKNGSDKAVSMDKTITPPAGPLVSNGADVYLTADFIWWKAQQDGLTYAFNGTTDRNLTLNAEKGSLHEPHFKYEPGFKVGLGVLSNHDNWDFYSQYTWLKVEESDTKNEFHNKGTDNYLLGTDTFNFGSNPRFAEMEGKWGLNFNVLDIEMGRNFWLSKRLTMRPHVGMKFSWIKQDFDVHGEDYTLLDAPSKLDYEFDLHQFGVGVRAGLDNSFYMANKWSIFGDLAVTGLWNSFKSSREDTYQATPASTEFEPAHVHYRPHSVTAVLELDLGLRFETIFSKGRYMYMLQAGWETQVWFNQGQFVSFNSLPTPGNLSMQGLTIKTGFWF